MSVLMLCQTGWQVFGLGRAAAGWLTRSWGPAGPGCEHRAGRVPGGNQQRSGSQGPGAAEALAAPAGSPERGVSQGTACTVLH